MPSLRPFHIYRFGHVQPLEAATAWPSRRDDRDNSNNRDPFSSNRDSSGSNNNNNDNNSDNSDNSDDDSSRSRFRSTSTVYRFIRSTVTVTRSSTATDNAAAAGDTNSATTATLTGGDRAGPTTLGSLPGSSVGNVTPSPTPSTTLSNTASIRSAPTLSPSQAPGGEGSKVLQPGVVIAIIMGVLFFITVILVLWVFGQRFHFPGHRWKKLGKETYHQSGRTISSFEPKIYLPDGYDFTGGGDASKYQPWGQAEYRRRSAGSISLPSFNLDVLEGSGPTSPAISPLDIPLFTDVSSAPSQAVHPTRNQRPPPSAPVPGVGTDPIQTLLPVARRASLPSDTGSATSLPSVNEPRLVV